MPSRLVPLTGVRFFAAFSVILYHWWRINGAEMGRQHHDVMTYLGPICAVGILGVDFFFILSGVVLAWNYLDRLGPRFSVPDTRRYLRARLARIYPVYLLMTLVGGLAIWLNLHFWLREPYGKPSGISVFVQQVLMVQQWGQPANATTTWDGPAWSISCEFLAYLTVPLVMLVAWRLRRRPGLTLVLALLAMAPLVWMVWRHGASPFAIEFPWSWAWRIGCDFTAGVLLGVGLRRLTPTVKQRRWAELGVIVVIVGVIVWVEMVPRGRTDLVVAVFVPLIGLLAIARGPLSDLLSSRLAIVGGQLSYALYLLHANAFVLYRPIATSLGVPAAVRPYGELVVAALCVPAAWLIFRFFEEPLRERLVDLKFRPRPDPALTSSRDV